jgi:putative PIN family toxin of toxin-antitoxin system
VPNPKVSPQGLARDLLLMIVSGPHELVLSSPILQEVKRVLSYPHVQARWPLRPDTIETFLDFLAAVGVVVGLPDVTPAVVTDPDDDPILQTAIIGNADVLCTRDEDFRHPIVEQTCVGHGIRILDDITLLQEIRHLNVTAPASRSTSDPSP